jgi:hypothetical protein
MFTHPIRRYVNVIPIVFTTLIVSSHSPAQAQTVTAWLTTSSDCASTANTSTFTPGSSTEVTVCASGSASPNLICGLTTSLVAADSFTAAAGLTLTNRQVNPDMTPALSDAQIPLPLTLAQSYSAWHDLGAAWSTDQAPLGANVGVPIFTATVTVPATSSPNATWRITLDASAEHQQFVVDNTPAGQTPLCNLSGSTYAPNQPPAGTVAQQQKPIFILRNADAPDLAPSLAGLATTGIIGETYSASFTVINLGTQPASSNASMTVANVPPGLTVSCAPATPASLAADSSMTCTLSGTPSANGTYELTVTTFDAADQNPDNDSATLTLKIADPPPATPECTATPPTTADPNQIVSIACTVTAGTTNTITGGRCTPDPAVTESITCTGNAGNLGSNPTVVSRNTEGSASTQVDFQFTGTLTGVPLFSAFGLWLSAVLLALAGIVGYRRQRRR